MARKSILVVEDEIEVRSTIRDMLARQYNVLEAAMYSDAVEQFKKRIDLAVVDYVLPDYDGFDLSREIRKAKPALPIIMITGYSTENVAIKALRAGITDYLKKPLSLVYLARRVSEILDGNISKKDASAKYGSEPVENKEAFIMEGIALHIEENYIMNLTLDELSGKAGMDKFKFCKVFRNNFGQSFISYLNNIRLRNAVELLRNPNLNITEIAFFIGYESVEYFDRVFNRRYGVSPREYRKRLNQSD